MARLELSSIQLARLVMLLGQARDMNAREVRYIAERDLDFDLLDSREAYHLGWQMSEIEEHLYESSKAVLSALRDADLPVCEIAPYRPNGDVSWAEHLEERQASMSLLYDKLRSLVSTQAIDVDQDDVFQRGLDDLLRDA